METSKSDYRFKFIDDVLVIEVELLKQISEKNKSGVLSETSSKKRNNSEEGEVK